MLTMHNDNCHLCHVVQENRWHTT